MDKVDMVLLMSVNPGFGGQKFIPATLDKLREARKMIDASGRDIRLEIDGGVKVRNIREIAAAGADTFVAGSAIFNQPDYKAVIDAVRVKLIRHADDLLRELFLGELPRLVMFDVNRPLVTNTVGEPSTRLYRSGQPAAGVARVRDWVGNGARVLTRRPGGRAATSTC